VISVQMAMKGLRASPAMRLSKGLTEERPRRSCYEVLPRTRPSSQSFNFPGNEE
jgi:hypothetical protein